MTNEQKDQTADTLRDALIMCRAYLTTDGAFAGDASAAREKMGGAGRFVTLDAVNKAIAELDRDAPAECVTSNGMHLNVEGHQKVMQGLAEWIATHPELIEPAPFDLEACLREMEAAKDRSQFQTHATIARNAGIAEAIAILRRHAEKGKGGNHE